MYMYMCVCVCVCMCVCIYIYIYIYIYIGLRRERIISRDSAVVVVTVLGASSLGSLASVTSSGKVSRHPYRLWAPPGLLKWYIPVGLKLLGCEADYFFPFFLKCTGQLRLYLRAVHTAIKSLKFFAVKTERRECVKYCGG